MRSAPSIAFEFRSSRAIAAATAAVSLAAAIAPWQSALPVAARIALSATVGVACVTSLRRFLDSAVLKIAYRASGWTLVDRNETEHLVELTSHTRIGPWIALTFRDSARRAFRVVLGPDNLEPETRRRLVVLLSR